MCGITLIISLLEHLGQGAPEVAKHLHTINQFYIQGLEETMMPDYQNMIVQGFMMNFWFD